MNKYNQKVREPGSGLREVFQAPRLTWLALRVVKTIQASASQERKDALGAVTPVTS